MPRYHSYYPDYRKLYPGVEIPPQVLRVVRASDRKMRYMEHQLKTDGFVEDQENRIAKFIPSREDSLERLISEEKRQFPSGTDLEGELIVREELRCALDKLRKEYRQVLFYRYWEQMTQAEVAELLSMTQQGVSYREEKALKALKKLLAEK